MLMSIENIDICFLSETWLYNDLKCDVVDKFIVSKNACKNSKNW